MNHKLSLCMIVKNEEKTLKQCIESFLPVVDEIILVDTGSIDKTKEIAAEYKDVRIIYSDWQNDFSKARNLSLKFASNPLIMWTDADDILPPESVPLINKLKERPLNSFYYFNVVNTVNGEPVGQSFLQCRLFPNSSQIMFEGLIHEQITPSCIRRNLTPYKVENIKIYHTGYDDKSMVLTKANRNISLIKSIHGYSFSAYWLKQLGVSYQNKGNYRTAFEYFSQALEVEKTADTYFKAGTAKMLIQDYSEALKYLKLGLELEHDSVELNYHVGRIYDLTRKFGKAIDIYLKVLEMPEQISRDVHFFHECRMFAYQYLSDIYDFLEMKQQKKDIKKRMIEDYPSLRGKSDKL